MKHSKIFQSFATLLLCAFAFLPSADGQTNGSANGIIANPGYNFTYVLTNVWSGSNAANTYTNVAIGPNINAPGILIRPGYGLSFTCILTNGGTNGLGNAPVTNNSGSITFYFARSIDGQNYDTASNYLTFVVPLTSGTNGQISTTNFPNSYLDGFQSLQLVAWTNGGTNGVFPALEVARPKPWGVNQLGF